MRIPRIALPLALSASLLAVAIAGCSNQMKAPPKLKCVLAEQTLVKILLEPLARIDYSFMERGFTLRDTLFLKHELNHLRETGVIDGAELHKADETLPLLEGGVEVDSLTRRKIADFMRRENRLQHQREFASKEYFRSGTTDSLFFVTLHLNREEGLFLTLSLKYQRNAGDYVKNTVPRLFQRDPVWQWIHSPDAPQITLLLKAPNGEIVVINGDNPNGTLIETPNFPDGKLGEPFHRWVVECRM